MSILLLIKLFLGFGISSLVGLLILLYPVSSNRRMTARNWERSAGLCLVLAALMGLFAVQASVASDAAWGSMTIRAKKWLDSMGFLAASAGFGMAAVIGGTEMVLILMSRRSRRGSFDASPLPNDKD